MQETTKNTLKTTGFVVCGVITAATSGFSLFCLNALRSLPIKLTEIEVACGLVGIGTGILSGYCFKQVYKNIVSPQVYCKDCGSFCKIESR